MSRRRWLWVAALVVVVAGAVVVAERAGVERSAPQVAGTAKYQCAMHPQIVSDRPGVCPICQMKLQRVDEPAAHAVGEEPTVPGHAPFTLSTERQQLIGVTTGTIERRDLTQVIRTAGKVAYDPELYQTIVEYREALGAKRRIGASDAADVRRGADAIVRAAALRLRQRGLSAEQLDAIARDGGDPTSLILPGKTTWVYAQVYEYELDRVHAGQTADITGPSAPGRSYTGKVVAIDPILNATTRTARARILVATPDAGLRPEAFVDATIAVPLGRVLAIPDGAVLDTGEHRIAFVVEGDGRFEPRSVTLGRDADGYTEVLDGLSEGEKVVTSANFLIDSESRFRAALATFGTHGH